MNLLTIIVLVYLLIAICLGYQRGAVRMILALAGTIVTIILASVLISPISGFLESYTPLKSIIYDGVDQYVGSVLEEKLQQSVDTWNNETLPELEAEALENLPLPKEWCKWLETNNTQEQYNRLEVDNFLDYVNSMITNFIFTCICFAIVFVVVKLIISVLLMILNGITSLPVIHQMNGLAGVVIALVESLIMLWCLCLILSAFGTSDIGKSFMQQINESVFLQLIYNNNPIMNFFFK